jgi:tetratricopeptide (TPR) repeat protein
VAIDRDKTLQAAAKLVDKKKYDKAIAEYQKVVQADPSDARTLLRIGDLQSRISDFAGAVATYDQVGRYYGSQGFHLKAIAVYKQIRELIKKHAPELGPRYAHVLPKLAEIYAELGLVSDALIAYDEIAANLQSVGRDREAVAVLQKTVQLDPQNPLPYLRLAEACCRTQDLDAAINAFWTAAQILLSLGRPDDALKVLERILTFRPEPQYARASAALYLRHNTNEAAMAALARLQVAFQANPKDLETLSLLAQAFDVIQQPEKAFAVHLEMARLARDQQKGQLFSEILDHLRRVAPGHEQVVLLERLGPGGPSVAPGPPAPVEPRPVSGQPGVRPPLTRPPGSRPLASSRPPSIEIDLADDVLLDDEDEDAYDDVEFIEEAPSLEAKRLDPVPVGPSTERQSGLEAVESFQPASSTRKAIVNADAFLRLGLIDKAVEVLHLALELDPNSIPVREKLREILVEAGEREAAIEETLNIAIIHLHHQNIALAEPLIVEVLDIEPEHPEALNLLSHLEALKATSVSPKGDGHLESFDLEGVPPSSALKLPPSGPLPKFESTPPQPPRDRPSPDAIDEVLEEAEFFAAQGLYEDAEAILADTLSAAPGHVLLTERLAEVRASMAALGQTSRSAAAPPLSAEDAAFDIAASLDALDDFDPVMPKAASPTEQVDVDLVFAKFKEGIKATVDDSDASTHYDLGVAYKEMGLADDARSEFELASRDPQRAMMCHYMIGTIFRDQNELGKARDEFLKALRVEVKTEDQTKALEYDLAAVYEAQGDRDAAIVMLKAIHRKDTAYRDVPERMQRLGAKPSLNPSDEDAELDRALENLFG